MRRLRSAGRRIIWKTLRETRQHVSAVISSGSSCRFMAIAGTVVSTSLFFALTPIRKGQKTRLFTDSLFNEKGRPTKPPLFDCRPYQASLDPPGHALARRARTQLASPAQPHLAKPQQGLPRRTLPCLPRLSSPRRTLPDLTLPAMFPEGSEVVRNSRRNRVLQRFAALGSFFPTSSIKSIRPANSCRSL